MYFNYKHLENVNNYLISLSRHDIGNAGGCSSASFTYGHRIWGTEVQLIIEVYLYKINKHKRALNFLFSFFGLKSSLEPLYFIKTYYLNS